MWHVHNLVDVLGAQAVFRPILGEAHGSVDHENAFAGHGVVLVEYEDAGRDTPAIKQIGGQADDALDVPAQGIMKFSVSTLKHISRC